MFSFKAKTLVEDYNNVFENLLQEFRDRAARDTLLVVHRIWEGFPPMFDDARESFSKDPLSKQPDI